MAQCAMLRLTCSTGANKIACDPQRLAALKARLEGNRLTFLLFETNRFAGRIEAAYRVAYDRYHGGLDYITVVS